MFSALIIISILVCLRLLCYALKRLLRRDDDNSDIARNSNIDGNRVEMQPGNRVPGPVSSYMRKTMAESLSVTFQGDDRACFGPRHEPLP